MASSGAEVLKKYQEHKASFQKIVAKSTDESQDNFHIYASDYKVVFLEKGMTEDEAEEQVKACMSGDVAALGNIDDGKINFREFLRILSDDDVNEEMEAFPDVAAEIQEILDSMKLQDKATGSKDKDRKWVEDLGVQDTLTNAVKALLSEQLKLKQNVLGRPKNPHDEMFPGPPEFGDLYFSDATCIGARDVKSQKVRMRQLLANYFFAPELITDTTEMHQHLPALEPAFRLHSKSKVKYPKMSFNAPICETIRIYDENRERLTTKEWYSKSWNDEYSYVVDFEKLQSTSEELTDYEIDFLRTQQEKLLFGPSQDVQTSIYMVQQGFQSSLRLTYPDGACNSDTAVKFIISMNEMYARDYDPTKKIIRSKNDKSPYEPHFIPYDYSFHVGDFDVCRENIYRSSHEVFSRPKTQYALFTTSMAIVDTMRDSFPAPVHARVARSTFFTTPVSQRNECGDLMFKASTVWQMQKGNSQADAANGGVGDSTKPAPWYPSSIIFCNYQEMNQNILGFDGSVSFEKHWREANPEEAKTKGEDGKVDSFAVDRLIEKAWDENNKSKYKSFYDKHPGLKHVFDIFNNKELMSNDKTTEHDLFTEYFKLLGDNTATFDVLSFQNAKNGSVGPWDERDMKPVLGEDGYTATGEWKPAAFSGTNASVLICTGFVTDEATGEDKPQIYQLWWTDQSYESDLYFLRPLQLNHYRCGSLLTHFDNEEQDAKNSLNDQFNEWMEKNPQVHPDDEDDDYD